MSNVKLLVELTQEKQIEIEEMCHREGLTFSKYFLDLHENEQKRKYTESVREEAIRQLHTDGVVVRQPQSLPEEPFPSSRTKKEKKNKYEKEA